MQMVNIKLLDYIKKMLRRDPELKSRWGTICPPTEMVAADGKRYKTQAADLQGIFPYYSVDSVEESRTSKAMVG